MQAALTGGWDALCDALNAISFVRMPNAPREYANSPIKAAAKESRDRVKDTVKKTAGIALRQCGGKRGGYGLSCPAAESAL